MKSSCQHWNVVFLFILFLMMKRISMYDVLCFLTEKKMWKLKHKPRAQSTKHNEYHLSSSTPWLFMTNSRISNQGRQFTSLLVLYHILIFLSFCYVIWSRICSFKDVFFKIPAYRNTRCVSSARVVDGWFHSQFKSKWFFISKVLL